MEATRTDVTVVVLSSRFDVPSKAEDSTHLEYAGLTPLQVSDIVKAHVERHGSGRIKCFSPIRDSMGTADDSTEKFSSVWLKTWRRALLRAQQTGGCVLRLDLDEVGRSTMQEVQTDMAADKGVPVVIVRFGGQSTEGDIQMSLEDGSGHLRSDLISRRHEFDNGIFLNRGDHVIPVGSSELHEAAAAGRVNRLKACGLGVDELNAANQHGQTPLMLAARQAQLPAVQALLEAGADPNIKDNLGTTALGYTAMNGSVDVARELLAQGADATIVDNFGGTAAKHALMNKHPIIYALCDPNGAKARGEELRDAFRGAAIVHVLSTRFTRDPSLDDVIQQRYESCDPRRSAATLKQVLEVEQVVLKENGTLDEDRSNVPHPEGQHYRVKVFDPNADNAFLMEGDAASANAIWLLNWREVGLENAARTGGSCIQVLVQPGPSKMQIAEESMAKERGVPVVKIDCSEVFVALSAADAVEIPEVQALRAQAEIVRSGGRLPTPLTRAELEQFRNMGIEKAI